MKLTRQHLIDMDWKFVKRIGKNSEIWKKKEEMLLWNRETLKAYIL